jgi:hypothetical protein
MKGFSKIIVFLIFINTLSLFLSCRKDDLGPDYRDQYIGKYNFNIKYSYPVGYDSLHFLIQHDSIYPFSGSIIKSKKSNNKIIVDWGNNPKLGPSFAQNNELTVDSSGILTYPEYADAHGLLGNYVLYNPSSIRNDTIKFEIGAGGLGWYSTWRVIGVKVVLD